MHEEIKQLGVEIKRLEYEHEFLVRENCSAKIKSLVLKKIIVLYEKMQEVARCENIVLDDKIKKEEEKYFDYYLAYQDGKLLKSVFFPLMKRLLNLSNVEYDFSLFRFNSGYEEKALRNLESSFLILIEKEKMLELKMKEYNKLNVSDFKNYLFEYFKDGGEGVIFSDTHCLDFEFQFSELNMHMINTVDGNPIYVIQDVNNSFFASCINDACCYMKEYGFDCVVPPVSKIKKKIYFD